MNPSGFIDHTLLKPPVCKKNVENLCKEAVDYDFHSVCIPPAFVACAKKIVKYTDIKVCTVIGFPFGYTTSHIKFLESRNAEARGVDELDIVLNTGYLKEGEDRLIVKELSRIITSFPHITHKVIIETCLLEQKEKEKAAMLVYQSGAEFIKTSTGFLGRGAAAEDVKLLKSVVGENLKVKASGGIKDLNTLMEMIDAGASRIGTSSGVRIMEEYFDLL